MGNLKIDRKNEVIDAGDTGSTGISDFFMQKDDPRSKYLKQSRSKIAKNPKYVLVRTLPANTIRTSYTAQEKQDECETLFTE